MTPFVAPQLDAFLIFIYLSLFCYLENVTNVSILRRACLSLSTHTLTQGDHLQRVYVRGCAIPREGDQLGPGRVAGLDN